MKESVAKYFTVATIGYGMAIIIGANAIAAILFYTVPVVAHYHFNQLLFAVVAFIIYGFIHEWLANKDTHAAFTASTTSDVRNSALLTIAIALSISVQSVLFVSSSLFLPFVSAASFFLPFVSVAAYRHFQYIPPPQYSLWFSQKNLIANRSIVFLSTLPVKIKVAPTLLHKCSSVYPCIVPAQLDVGTVFQYFLARQQYKKTAIENEDEIGNPVGWLFYEENWQGHKIRPLNPDLNLRDNKVAANAVVVAKRIIIDPDTVPLLSAKYRSHELHKQ